MADNLDSGAPAVAQGTADSPSQAGAGMAAPAEKKSFMELNSLRLAGISNLIGDIGFLGAGLRNGAGNKYKVAGGALYTLGGLNLALFGEVKPDEVLLEAKQETARFMEGQTGHKVELALVTGGEAPKSKNSLHFLSQNVAQNTLYAYTLGAAALLMCGIHKYRADNKQWAGLAYGVSSMAFKLASLAIPEKGEDDDLVEKPHGFVHWVQERPLRVLGYGSLLTDTALGLQAYQEYMHNPHGKDYGWAALTTVTYLVADLLIARSHKDPSNAGGKLPTQDQLQVVQLAAKVIAREPQDKQDDLVKEIGKYLASLTEISGKADEIATAIRQEMAQKHVAPWASRIKENMVVQPAR